MYIVYFMACKSLLQIVDLFEGLSFVTEWRFHYGVLAAFTTAVGPIRRGKSAQYHLLLPDYFKLFS